MMLELSRAIGALQKLLSGNVQFLYIIESTSTWEGRVIAQQQPINFDGTGWYLHVCRLGKTVIYLCSDTAHSLIAIILSSNRSNQLPARGGAGTGSTSGGKGLPTGVLTELQVPQRPTSRRGTCSYTSGRHMVRLITHSTHYVQLMMK